MASASKISKADEKPTTVMLNVGSILNEARYEVFKAFEMIEQKLGTYGIDLSEELNSIRGEILGDMQDTVPEIRELIEWKCKEMEEWKSIRLIDRSENDLLLDFPDSWPDDDALVTCKKCFFQYDGNAQHMCK